MSKNLTKELQTFADKHRTGVTVHIDRHGNYTLDMYGGKFFSSNDPARVQRKIFDIAVSQMAYYM